MLKTIVGKSRRALEASHMLMSVGDFASRKSLIDIYANLGRRDRYDERVDLNLSINGRNVPITMRFGDIFVVGEILHQKQYALQTKLPDAPVIFDLGANVGISLAWFFGSFPDATLYGFEPHPDNVAFLHDNFGIYDNVRIEAAGVGSETGTLSLFEGPSAAEHTLGAPDANGALTVPVLALSDYMETNAIQKIDLLKIDVEGAEIDVLRGLGDRIGDVTAMVGEIHETLIDDRDFYAILDNSGFDVLRKTRVPGDDGVHIFEAVNGKR